jgi:hypothetical protein
MRKIVNVEITDSWPRAYQLETWGEKVVSGIRDESPTVGELTEEVSERNAGLFAWWY